MDLEKKPMTPRRRLRSARSANGLDGHWDIPVVGALAATYGSDVAYVVVVVNICEADVLPSHWQGITRWQSLTVTTRLGRHEWDNLYVAEADGQAILDGNGKSATDVRGLVADRAENLACSGSDGPVHFLAKLR